MEILDFEGTKVKPWKDGKYRCPHNCGSPGYPRKKWGTQKGFEKHMLECPLSESRINSNKEKTAALQAANEEKMSAYLIASGIRVGDTVSIVKEVVVRGTHEARGERMVKVRYERELRYEGLTIKIDSIHFLTSEYQHSGGSDYMYFNNDTRLLASEIRPNFEAAKSDAIEMQKKYKESCDFASFCR